jgi:site-specific recombinase XerD
MAAYHLRKSGLMGHSNIATTTRYLHLSDADLLEAVDRAFPEN